jgi:phage terminase large subunit
VYKYNGGYVLDEELCRKGMSNKALADYINNMEQPNTLVIADSAEPKSIDELRSYGVSVLPASKGPGSINQGIQLIQSVPIFVTKRSVNLLREQRNYLWMSDKEGRVMNVPTPGQDHLLDATRYAIASLNPFDTVSKGDVLQIY